MQLPIHTVDTAPAESRDLLEGIRADLGVLPNLAATAATSPALLAGFDGLRRAVATTKLDPVLREVTGLAVGVAVDNRYGVAFHSTMLAGLGVDEADIDAMRRGGAPPTRSPPRSTPWPVRLRSNAGRSPTARPRSPRPLACPPRPSWR